MGRLSLDRRRLLQLLGFAAAGSVAGRPLSLAAAPLTLDQIKRNGVLRIGCEATYRPFTFREQGQIVGYDVDLADLLCQPLGVKPQFIDTAWAGVIPALYAGRFDIIMSSVSYTRERMEKVGFSIPYTEASQALLVRAKDADGIKGIDDMAGRVLGVKLGSPGEILQKKLNESLVSRRGKGFADVKTYDDHPAAYLALAQGTVDGVLNTLPTLTQVLKDAPGRYALVRIVGQENWAGIAARKEDTEIVNYLDRQIGNLKQDGRIYRLQEKWFGLRMNLPDKVPELS